MTYTCIDFENLINGCFKIKPIQSKHKLLILKWRNEQINHLRQEKKLTESDQEDYFQYLEEAKKQHQPRELLFSFYHNQRFVGYGGLVHINWKDRNAEISFLMNTDLQRKYFERYWKEFLYLIEIVAFTKLNFKKIFTYAFDIRQHLYPVLKECNFIQEARLRNHVLIDNIYYDVVIHSKENQEFRSKLFLKKATELDLFKTFDWINHPSVRENSLNPKKIPFSEHETWFNKAINDKQTKYFILVVNNNSIGQIRLNFKDGHWVINYLIDPGYRGLGYGKIIMEMLIEKYGHLPLKGTVLKKNIASIKVFETFNFNKKIENDNIVFFRKPPDGVF